MAKLPKSETLILKMPFGAQLSALFVSAGDLGTEEGRAAERQRRIALSAAATLAARLLTALVSLLTVPLTIGYLGNDRYGLWLTASSVVSIIGFADLGIGNGLITKVAEAHGREDHEGLRRLISSAFFMLLGVATFLALATLASASFVDWAGLLGVTGATARAEVSTAVLLLAFNWYLAMPFSVVQHVQNGLQSGYASTLWTIAGALLSLLGLLAATTMRAGLPALILVLSGIPTLVIIVNFAWYFMRERPEVRPVLRAFDRSRATSLLHLGALYMVLQVAWALAFVTDNVVIARALGPAAVPSLAVPAKLFALLALPVSIFIGPLWPAYGEARVRKDYAWIRRTLRRSIQTSVALAATGGGLLVLVGPLLIRIWTHGAVSARRDVLLALAIWTCLSVWGQAVDTFLNGLGKIRVRAVASVLMAAAAYSLKLVLVRPLGSAGVAWATVIAHMLFYVLPISWVVRHELRLAGASLQRSQD